MPSVGRWSPATVRRATTAPSTSPAANPPPGRLCPAKNRKAATTRASGVTAWTPSRHDRGREAITRPPRRPVGSCRLGRSGGPGREGQDPDGDHRQHDDLAERVEGSDVGEDHVDDVVAAALVDRRSVEVAERWRRRSGSTPRAASATATAVPTSRRDGDADAPPHLAGGREASGQMAEADDEADDDHRLDEQLGQREIGGALGHEESGNADADRTEAERGAEARLDDDRGRRRGDHDQHGEHAPGSRCPTSRAHPTIDGERERDRGECRR